LTGSTLNTNLALTGSTLQTNINTLTTNVGLTGSTLQTNINNLSNTYATTSNVALTGSTLQTNINNLSGYINSSSSNIVFTTGNQTISGVKSFAQDTVFGDSAQGDFLVISGNNFTVYGSGNFTSGLFVNGNAVLTGVNLTPYATTINLANTGSTLDTKINNLSGVSVLRFGDQTINGLKTFTSGIDIYSGTSPQSLRIFNRTGTNSGEFGSIGWTNNQFVIGSQQSQSGILRDVVITGNNININGSGALNIFDNTNIVGNLTVSGNTTITGHLSAASKSFLINHPTQVGKKLQYGSLESPYHGIRLTDKNKISAEAVKVYLPDYISSLVNDEKVNIQLTNINHDKNLFVKEVNINENNFIVGMNRGWFDKNEYEFYWSFTAERKDIPKLTVEF
jgi:hypothetical protein